MCNTATAAGRSSTLLWGHRTCRVHHVRTFSIPRQLPLCHEQSTDDLHDGPGVRRRMHVSTAIHRLIDSDVDVVTDTTHLSPSDRDIRGQTGAVWLAPPRRMKFHRIPARPATTRNRLGVRLSGVHCRRFHDCFPSLRTPIWTWRLN